ncbi:hypothetical protein DPMN_006854 [Dreissena polymorpha]|uniref:Potassium channel domain-containing protein n=1 Tax=Dreissena polymorpha TaxID=45954 RepID=A0A9D4MV19_DREPO|nr:hypothetical protein DPMN_006854 [Dreissena polymorpha]
MVLCMLLGYGHIAPKTFEGHLVTIFYAMIGIPMTLLCLSNMGEILSDCFRLLYKHLCQLLTWMCCPPEDSFTKRRSTTPSKMAQSRSGSTVQTFELNPLKVRPDEGDSNTLKVARPIQPMTRKHRRQNNPKVEVDHLVRQAVKQKVKLISLLKTTTENRKRKRLKLNRFAHRFL